MIAKGTFNPGRRPTPMPAQARPRFGANNPGLGKQFTPFAAGRKVYGGGRAAPNVGKTANMAGYKRRDGMMRARRQAFIDRMKGFG